MLTPFLAEDKIKLDTIAEGAEVNVQSDWTQADTGADDYVKNKPNPSRLCTYLPVASPYTTPTLVAGTPTKIAPGSTVKTALDFTLDVPNTRYFLDDITASGKWFSVNASTSISTSSSNHLATFEVYKNGVFEEGLGISRWIAAGADTGALSITGALQLSYEDYIEIYVTDSGGGTITLYRLSISVTEIVGAT